MKYEFIKKDIDSFELIFTNKDNQEIVKPFKRTIEMAKRLDGITAEARIKLITKLSQMGLKKDDLVVKTDLGNGQVVYDESNYKLLEDEMIQETSLLITNELIEKCFNKNVKDLLEEMGIDTNSEKLSNDISTQITLFTQKFLSIITGKEEQAPSTQE